MKHFTLIFLAISFLSYKVTAQEINTSTIPSLTLVWETDTLLTTCESALYDENSDLIFVSNINNNPWELDYNGFISTLDTDGNILELKWLEADLSGPKGMSIKDGKLYINDINRMVEVDMATSTITNAYTLDGKVALNDISISPQGQIYSSDSDSSSIYKLDRGQLKKIGQTPDGRLNGLLATDSTLYFSLSQLKQLGVYNLETGISQILTNDIGWADGIVQLKDGHFITSSWTGEIYHINTRDWSKTLLIDTKDQNINAADIGYIPQLDLIIVPTFFHNTVRAYKLEW